MADDDMILDDDSSESSSKKGSGIGSVIHGALKWVAIGIGAIILIVTVVIITMNIADSNTTQQAVIPINEAYTPTREIYSWYEDLPEIRTKTYDPIPANVLVHVVLGYEEEDTAASTELIKRRVELQDYLRKYFSSKRSKELAPLYEDALKLEIKNDINDLLTNSSIKDVRFLKYDIINQ